jgi:hypothetical protein
MTRKKNDPVLEQAIDWLIDIFKKTNAPRSGWNSMLEFLSMVRNKNPDLDFEQFMHVFKHDNETMAIIAQLLTQKMPPDAKDSDILGDVLSLADFKEAFDVAEQFQNSENMKTKQ